MRRAPIPPTPPPASAVAIGSGFLLYSVFAIFRPFLHDLADGAPAWVVVPLSLLVIAAALRYWGWVLVRRLRSPRDPKASRELIRQLRREAHRDRQERRVERRRRRAG